MSHLLPCPFCGGSAAIGTTRYSSATIIEQNWGQDTFYNAYCIGCGASNRGMVGHRTEEKAIEKWNTRANPANVPRGICVEEESDNIAQHSHNPPSPSD